MLDKREAYALKLAQYIYDRQPVIYLDETTFNYHMRQRKAWQYADDSIAQSFKLPLNNTRFSGVTVFGCIGNGLKKPVMMSAPSTNIEDFRKFIIKVIQ